MASPLAAPQPLSPYAAGWPIADHAAGNRHKNGGVRGSGALELVVALKHAHTFGMVHTDDLCNKSGNKNSFVVDAFAFPWASPALKHGSALGLDVGGAARDAQGTCHSIMYGTRYTMVQHSMVQRLGTQKYTMVHDTWHGTGCTGVGGRAGHNAFGSVFIDACPVARFVWQGTGCTGVGARAGHNAFGSVFIDACPVARFVWQGTGCTGAQQSTTRACTCLSADALQHARAQLLEATSAREALQQQLQLIQATSAREALQQQQQQQQLIQGACSSSIAAAAATHTGVSTFVFHARTLCKCVCAGVLEATSAQEVLQQQLQQLLLLIEV
eukprot:1144460-Pelagomonas_calceolata.AAC.2